MLRKSILVFLFSMAVWAYFYDVEDLSGYSEGSVAYLTWTLERTSTTLPGGASAFRYEMQWSLDGTFSDFNLGSTSFEMVESGGNEWIEEKHIGGLAAGNWRFRLRVVSKAEDQYGNVIPVTGWSNIALIPVAEGLGVPTLSLHTGGQDVVKTATLSMSIGGDPRAKYDLYYGTDPQPSFWPDFVHPNVNPTLHEVNLAADFLPDTSVYFQVKATYLGEETWSTVADIFYSPDAKFTNYVPVVVNNESHTTSLYLRSSSSEAGLVEFTALVGESLFGTGSPQTYRTFFGPEDKLHFTINELFGLVLHQKPMTIVSEYPLEVTVVYHSKMGGSANISLLPAVTKADRSLTIEGLFGNSLAFPGAAISNVSELEGTVVCFFVWVSNLEPSSFQAMTRTYAFSLRGYKSHVFTFEDAFPELEHEDYVGTLYIEASIPIVAVGSVANAHTFHDAAGNVLLDGNGEPVEFRTIDFINQSE